MRRSIRSIRSEWFVVAPILAVLMIVGSAGHEAVAQSTIPSTKSCTRCHFPSAGERGLETPAPGAPAPFCRQEEAGLWEQRDKHRQSMFLLLNNENRPLTNQILGFDIAGVLTFKLEPRTYRPLGGNQDSVVDSVTNVQIREDAVAEKLSVVRDCLACHSPLEEPSVDDPTVTSLEFGVSCQACHGVATDYYRPHEDVTRVWRVLDANVKQSAFGMVDLRHPYRRAQRCAECHVGAWPQGNDAQASAARRFVRHEWYAAGHPPLPSLEFVTFASQMPAHWRTLREKAAEPKPFLFLQTGTDDDERRRQALKAAFHRTYLSERGLDANSLATNYLEANRQSLSSVDVTALQGEQPRSRDVLVSGLAVLAAYADLLARAPTDYSRDLALYDCGACHHELRSRFPSEARVRRPLQPGRPPPAYWTLALARLAARQAEPNVAPSDNAERQSSFEAAIAELNAAFSARPFGDPQRVAAAAERLRLHCETLAQTLVSQPLDEALAENLLAALVAPDHDVDRDYHAARQYAWAIREVLKDLAGVPHRTDALGLSPAARPAAKRLSPRVLVALGAKADAQVLSDDPRVVKRIDGLFGDDPWFGPLRLRLPAGQRETIVGQLPDSLRAISTYDPAFFRERLEPIRAQYPGR